MALQLVGLTSSAQTTDPQQVAQLVANRIVEECAFDFIKKPIATRQEYSWYFDYQNMPASASTNTHYVISELVFQKESESAAAYQLAVSHTAGRMVIKIGEQTFESTTENDHQLIRQDYELLDFLTYFSLSKVKKTEKTPLPVSVYFYPTKDTQPSFWIGFVEADSRMTTRQLSLQNPLWATASTAFAVRPKAQQGVVSDLPPMLPATPLVHHFPSRLNFTDWRYYTGTFLTAMNDVTNHFGTLDQSPFIEQHLQFFYKNKDKIAAENHATGRLSGPFTLYFRNKMLDDFGPQGTAVLHYLDRKYGNDLAGMQQDPFYSILENILDNIQNKVARLKDGTLVRITPDTSTVQSDDLFMAGLPLIRAAKVLQRPELLEDAVTQSLNFHKYLYNEQTELYHHAYFTWSNEQSCCHWGRGMGWMMMIYVELLHALPDNHPQRPTILKNYRAVCSGLLRYQNEDGRWHQIITDPNTYLETSATAMFVRALAEGCTNKWFTKKERKKMRAAAQLGWSGLCSKLEKDGQVMGIVRGTPIFETANQYANWNTRPNDPRGLGAVLWAAIAMDKLLK